MLSGWLAQGLAAKRVVVIEPHPSDEIRALAAKGVRLNPPPRDAGQVAALVVALKPQAFREAGPGLKPFAGPATLVVSIMAGTTIAAIAEVLIGKDLGGSVVRAMPNTPAAIGRGITVAVAANNVGAAQRAVADRLLRATGSVEWVEDEGLMDAVTAVSGSGPAYVFLLAEELARAGVAGRAARSARRPNSRAKPSLAPANYCIAPNFPPRRCARTSPRPAAPRRRRCEVLMGPDGLQSLLTRAVAAATRRSKATGEVNRVGPASKVQRHPPS